jgi:hypothetical protein
LAGAREDRRRITFPHAGRGKNGGVIIAVSTVAIVAVAAVVIVALFVLMYILPRGGRRSR